MTHKFRFLLLAGALMMFCAAMSFGQTLADAARAQQSKNKPGSATGHVYTNDSMEFHPAPAAPAATTAADTDTTAAASDKADAKGADTAAADDADSPEAKKKAADELKDKVAKQVAEIAQLQREMNILQREGQIRAAEYYSDAGARLRDPKAFDDADRKQKSDIAAKQKAIADAQAQLDKLREEARKAGISVS